MLTNADITIFNSRLNTAERREEYIPTVIRGVSFHESVGSTVSSSGAWSDAMQFRIRIPEGAAVQDGRTYLPEREYAALDDTAAVQHWTLKRGDMLMRAVYDSAGAISQAEVAAAAEATGTALISIVEYADDTSRGATGSRHWRVGGN